MKFAIGVVADAKTGALAAFRERNRQYETSSEIVGTSVAYL